MSMERRILRAVGGVAALLLIAMTRVDADLWGHVRFGGDILDRGFTSVDPYSFTSDIPWVNHEWLTEVAFWYAWSLGGNLGLVLLKVALVGGMLAFAWSVLRRTTLPPLASEALFVILVFGTWARTSVVRPQLFSLLLFAALLWIFESVERGRTKRIWWVPVVFILWVNLHGGWIVGFGMTAVWAAFMLAGTPRRLSLPHLFGAAAASTAALLVNPYGWHMLEFIATTVRVDRSDVVDWLPLWTSAFLTTFWLCSTTLTVLVLWRHWSSVTLWRAAFVICLAVASLRVSRLDAFYAISAAMLLGPYLGVPHAVRRSLDFAPGPLLAAIATAVGVIVGSATQRPLWCVALDAEWLPEREAGAFIHANKLEGKLLTWFDWGEFVIWHFGPKLQVSLDGRRETVYSDQFLRRHYDLYDRPRESVSVLDSLNPDYAWLPSTMLLVRALEEQGWVKIFSGPRSTIFARRTGQFVSAPPIATSGCFPGP